MRARTWTIFIGVSVLFSLVVALVVTFLWEWFTSAPPAPTPAPAEAATAATSPTPAPSPTPEGPLLYTVQEGDTLSAIATAFGVTVEELMAVNGIADPHLLQVGQVLIIPVGGLPTPTIEPTPTPEPPPTPIPPPTPPPAGPPLIEIAQVLGSGRLEEEVVILRNRGGPGSLQSWTLSDVEGNVFTFPTVILYPGAQLRVYSAAGDTSPTALYWGRTAAAWDAGELITLRDAEGTVVDTYIVP